MMRTVGSYENSGVPVKGPVQRALDYNLQGYSTDCADDAGGQDCSYNFGVHKGIVSSDASGPVAPLTGTNCAVNGNVGGMNVPMPSIQKSNNVSASYDDQYPRHHHRRMGSGNCWMLILGLILFGLLLFMLVQMCQSGSKSS